MKKISKNIKYLLLFVSLLILIMSCNVNTAFAEPAIHIQEEQREKARQDALDKKEREERRDVFLQEPSKGETKIELPQEEVNFFIKNIELEGKHIEKFNWLYQHLKVYENKHIGLNGINLILKEANNSLIDRGFVTSRVVVQEQDLSSGVLKFYFMPGMINAILFDETSSGNWKTAFPTRPGSILNLRDLEQGLEQLKRVASQDADMQIIPAAEEGKSDILITVKRTKPWKLMTSLDDSGSKATGKLQSSQTLSIDNIFQANDLFNISLNHDAEKNGRRYGTSGNSFYYSRPSGNYTYTLSYNSFKYHQRIFAELDPLIYSGHSKDLRLKVEKLLQRNQNSKTHLELGLIHRQSKSFVEDTEIRIQRKKTTTFTTALAQKKYLGKAVFDARLTHKLGVPWFDAQADLRESTGFTTRYQIWNLDLSFTKPVVMGKTQAQYKVNLSGQFTNNRLLAADCFSIGSRYTVRGFDGEETLMGERGWYLQNEISVPLKNNAEIYLGLDYGQVGGPSADQLTTKSLLGAVVGVRGSLGKVGWYDVFAGSPLKKPASFKAKKQTYGFQVVFQI
ncbi:MAG: ShlB/FhaC/HecB family hemolysin secretion/activation protein [Sporomusaceae bacterium]|jgi:hemolysin activation/secretion protein|nr:ShlB/FhaC/HecB family hemolysin secretion/activation protein [Sporomusaceae bacterium]